MSKILIFDWANAVNLSQYGYEHNKVVEADHHSLIDFFLGCGIKVMIDTAKDSDLDYILYVDTKLFSQR